MNRSLAPSTGFHLAALVLASASVLAQEKGAEKHAAPAAVAPAHQRVAGVITRSESAPAASGAATKRLTINIDIVWRDWVRDQVTVRPDASPRVQAERGANSVATKGQPESKNSDVVVVLDAKSKLETRFRAPDDETSRGTKDVAAVREPGTENDKDNAPSRAKGRSQETKATQFRMDDLARGLFVEVEYAQDAGRNVARAVTVLRPVEPADRTPETTGGESRAKSKPR